MQWPSTRLSQILSIGWHWASSSTATRIMTMFIVMMQNQINHLCHGFAEIRSSVTANEVFDTGTAIRLNRVEMMKYFVQITLFSGDMSPSCFPNP